MDPVRTLDVQGLQLGQQCNLLVLREVVIEVEEVALAGSLVTLLDLLVAQRRGAGVGVDGLWRLDRECGGRGNHGWGENVKGSEGNKGYMQDEVEGEKY